MLIFRNINRYRLQLLVGLHDRNQEGNFTWIDGTPAKESDILFSPTSTQNDDNLDCFVMGNDWYLDDIACNTGSRFGLCEKPTPCNTNEA